MYDYSAYPVAAADIPMLPIAPEGGTPAYPGDTNTPVTPIAPEGGMPAYPGPPGAGMPTIPMPDHLQVPDTILPPDATQNLSEVRFLHAAVQSVPYLISIGTRVAARNLRFAESTDYVKVTDGFRTITVMSAASPRMILCRRNIPFRKGEKATLAVINTTGGIDLMMIPDSTCENHPRSQGCFRFVNLSYNSVPLDVILFDGRVVFSDMRFKEVTTYRRARPGEYGFYIVPTPTPTISPYARNVDIETLEDMPLEVDDTYVPGYGNMSPFATFYETFEAGVSDTAYFAGLGTASYPYVVITLEN